MTSPESAWPTEYELRQAPIGDPSDNGSEPDEQIAGRIGPDPANAVESETRVRIVTAQEFAAIEEPGADPLLGEPGGPVIPEGGDVLLYGDGGASKTTLGIDLACHLAAGDPWLGIAIARAVKIGLIGAARSRVPGRARATRCCTRASTGAANPVAGVRIPSANGDEPKGRTARRR